MLCVMMGHAGNVPAVIMKCLLPFYVPAFFFITGYLKHDLPQSGCSKRILKRFKRLIVPYFLYNFLLLFFCVIIHHMGIGEIVFALKGILYSRFCLYSDLQDINNIFFFTVANSPLWFLTALFMCEMVFEFTFYGVKDNRKVIFRSVVLLGIGLFMEQLTILLPWSIDTAMTGVVLMAGGYCWKSIEPKLSKNYVYYVLFLVYVAVMMINVNPNMSVRYYGPYLLSIFLFTIGGITGTILMKKVCDLIVKCAKMTIVKNFFCLLGENSITILALHWFVFLFCDIVIDKCGMAVFWPLGYSTSKIVFALLVCISVAKAGGTIKKRIDYLSFRKL